MKKLTVFFLVLLGASGAVASPGREFLEPEEISAIREEQDPGKRVILYLTFAKRRIEQVKDATASKDSDAGDAIQSNLADYNSIFDALADSLANAREQRVQLSKPIQEMQRQGTEFLTYLQALAKTATRNKDDYRLTLEEAMDTTKDELADAKKGAFPEVKERKPPSDLPPSPPPSAERPPQKSGSGSSDSEEGPPRKKSPRSSQSQ
jgi:hypothetical protein